MLRFFTSRSYAEIGASQELSEDTARKRVERALDKLQRLLARRGVTSTTTALSLVLSREAVIAAPAGLATSVSGIALASVAGAVGTGFSTNFLTLMTAMKISGVGTLAAALLLCVSLIVNAFLFTRPGRESQSLSNEVKSSSAGPALVRAAESKPAAMAAVSRSLVADADLGKLRDQLRAAGASEDRVREVLYGILRRRYLEGLAAKRISRIERGWWRDDLRTVGVTRGGFRYDEPGTANERIDAPLAALLGPDPGRTALADARYGFLPPEMRMTFLQIERDTQLAWVTTGDAQMDVKTDVELARKARQANEERDSLLARLTPEQREEYAMRFGGLGTRLASQLEIVPGGTEEEFRKVYRLAKDYTNELGGSAAAEGGRGSDQSAQLGQPTVDHFVAVLGYDRALDYLWAGTLEYRMTAAVAQEVSLPSATAARFTQLAAETGAKAAIIQSDPALTPEERRAALQQLQQAVRPEVEVLLPLSARQKLPAPALAWFGQLAEGRYKIMTPVLPGALNFSLGVSMSIASGAPSASPGIPLPRRLPGL